LLILAADLQCLQRNMDETRSLAAEVLRLAEDNGFVHWAAIAAIFHGWAVALQGGYEAGIAQIRAGLEDYRRLGAKLAQPQWLTLLADALGSAGQIDQALTVLDQAQTMLEQTGEYLFEPPLRCLLGQLLLGQNQRKSAAACWQQALLSARRQGAKSLEQRITASLERL
jgi:predicted ATPase